jgi:hypothetical protein
MATPGELIELIGAVTDVPVATVTQHDRNLFLSGLRTKGGRGTSAAKVTARDAANLLVAVLASEKVKDSARTVLRYAATWEYQNYLFKTFPKQFKNGRISVYSKFKLPILDALPEEHSFIDVLETLITMAMDETFDKEIGSRPDFCQVVVQWPHTRGEIYLTPGRAVKGWQPLYQRYANLAKNPDRSSPIHRSAKIYSTPIRYVGALLGGRLDKLPPLTPRIASSL